MEEMLTSDQYKIIKSTALLHKLKVLRFKLKNDLNNTSSL